MLQARTQEPVLAPTPSTGLLRVGRANGGPGTLGPRVATSTNSRAGGAGTLEALGPSELELCWSTAGARGRGRGSRGDWQWTCRWMEQKGPRRPARAQAVIAKRDDVTAGGTPGGAVQRLPCHCTATPAAPRQPGGTGTGGTRADNKRGTGYEGNDARGTACPTWDWITR